MSLRTTRHTAAIVALPILRVVRRGDRHDVNDLTVDVQLELDTHEASVAPDPQAIARAAHGLAALHHGGEPEVFASAVAHHALTHFAHVRRVSVEVCTRGWRRLDLGGRPRDRDLIGPTGEVRVARVVTNGSTSEVTGGLREMQLITATTVEAQPLVLIRLDALWTYGWTEIPFDTQWQQVRRALTEAYAERVHVGAQLAYALAQAVLDGSPAVRLVDVRLETARRHAIDVTAVGLEHSGELYGDLESARGVHHVVIERAEIEG